MAKSKSESQTTQTSLTQDQRVAASDNAIAVSGGGTLIQQDVSDTIAIAAIEGATESAARVVYEGAELVRDVQGQSLDFAAGALESSISASQNIAEKSLEASQDTVRTNAELASTLATVAISNLEKNKRDPTDDTLQTVTATVARAGMVVGVAVVVVVGVYFYRRSSK